MSITSLRRSYGTSRQLEQDGIWVSPPTDDGVKIEFLVARQSRANRRWATKISRVYKETKDKIDAGLVIDDESVDQSVRVFCETNLLDWRGLKDEQGRPIPYSPEAGFKLLSELTDLYEYLNKVSTNRALYQHQEQAAIEKKSESTSDGS